MTFFQNVGLGRAYPKMQLKPELEMCLFNVFHFSEAALAADDGFKRHRVGLNQ